jgi:hypothetical protein
MGLTPDLHLGYPPNSLPRIRLHQEAGDGQGC